jgi:hypothetical protein
MTCYRGLNVFVRAGVLIQIEMKNWRSRLEASIPLFFAAFWEDITLFNLIRECFLWLGGEHLDCGSAELSVNFMLTRGHGSLFRDLYYWPVMLPGCRQSGGDPRCPSRGTRGD